MVRKLILHDGMESTKLQQTHRDQDSESSKNYIILLVASLRDHCSSSQILMAREEADDEENEDDGDDSQVEKNKKIANLQKAIAMMSEQMAELPETERLRVKKTSRGGRSK